MTSLAATPSTENTSSIPIQLALPGMPGGVQLEWGLAALQRAQTKENREAANDARQGALPGFGVMPGARWRYYSARKTGLEDLPAPYLELRRPRRSREWLAADRNVVAEVRARSVTLSTAQQWKTGAGVPPWFTGLVPKRLRQLVGTVWAGYRRGTFGVRDSQPGWAALLGSSVRTLRNHWRLAERLGLLSIVKLWKEMDRDGNWRDVCLLRPGPMLESFAGVAAFEFSKSFAMNIRASFPGESQVVRATKAAASVRSRALIEAAERYRADQVARHYAARVPRGELEGPRRRHTVGSSPEVFGPYLAAVLLSLAPPLEAPREPETLQEQPDPVHALESELQLEDAGDFQPAPEKLPPLPEAALEPQGADLLEGWADELEGVITVEARAAGPRGGSPLEHRAPSALEGKGTPNSVPEAPRYDAPPTEDFAEQTHPLPFGSGARGASRRPGREKEFPSSADGALCSSGDPPRGPAASCSTTSNGPQSPPQTDGSPGRGPENSQKPCPACRDIGLLGGCHLCGATISSARRRSSTARPSSSSSSGELSIDNQLELLALELFPSKE